MAVLLGVGPPRGAAAESVTVGAQPKQALAEHAAIYRHDGSRLALADVRALAAEGAFTPAAEVASTNFGLTGDAIWLKLDLATAQAVPERLLLALPAPRLDRVDFYAVGPGGAVTHQRAGDRRPLAQQPVRHRYPVFELPSRPETSYELYLRVQSTSLVNIQPSLWQPEAFFQQSQKNYAVLSLYFGAVLALIGYNLFLYLSLRENLYLSYVGFITFLGLALANTTGLANQFFWPGHSWLADRSATAASALAGLCGVLFAQRFLGATPRRLRLTWLMPALAVAFAATFAGSLAFALPPAFVAANILFVVAAVAALGLGSAALYYREPGTRFFVLPWTIFLATLVLRALANLGVIAENWLTAHAIMVGSGLQMLLLSLALADRLNALQKARDAAQNQALAAEQQRVTDLQASERQLESEIAERKRYEATLQRLAFYDSVTALPNRDGLIEQLDDALAASAQAELATAVLSVGLDGFSAISGTAGHDTSDRMLAVVAERLYTSAPTGATVARLRGDVFAVMIPNCQPSAIRNLETAARLLIDAVDQPVTIAHRQLRCGASVGIAVHSDHAGDATELVKNADLALLRAKQGGGNSFAWFDPQELTRAQRRQELAHGLRRALDAGELDLHYQPQLDARERWVGAEALMRWDAPGHGPVSPGDFIPVAEETGLIAAMGDWALEVACAQAAAWPGAAAGTAPRIAVNLAAPHLLDTDLPARVTELLAEYELAASALELEVTESAVMADMGTAIAVMTRLAETGVTLAVDDFGTGYSSLAYLKRLPVHRLKIDRTFVMNLPADSQDAALCRAILELGRSLGLEIIAEGVETRAQFDWLRDRGCDLFQGFYFAKPMPAADLAAWRPPPAAPES